MVHYHPIESGAPWANSDHADLRLFDWGTGTAEFVVIDDERSIRVSFGREVIVRMLDEFALSTEGRDDYSGLVPHHFAYRVEGDPFFEAQSKIWRDMQGTSLEHYRFITGAGCLDVITSAVPRFAIGKG